MHGYATFNMLYRGHIIAAVTRCVVPGPWTNIVRGNCVRETSVKWRNKIMQEITRNVANVFNFYAINSDRKWFFNALTFIKSLGRCWKPRPLASVFNTWRMLMHEKPCLIPIIIVTVTWYQYAHSAFHCRVLGACHPSLQKQRRCGTVYMCQASNASLGSALHLYGNMFYSPILRLHLRQQATSSYHTAL